MAELKLPSTSDMEAIKSAIQDQTNELKRLLVYKKLHIADEVTGKTYVLYVSNGKLMMGESEV